MPFLPAPAAGHPASLPAPLLLAPSIHLWIAGLPSNLLALLMPASSWGVQAPFWGAAASTVVDAAWAAAANTSFAQAPPCLASRPPTHPSYPVPCCVPASLQRKPARLPLSCSLWAGAVLCSMHLTSPASHAGRGHPRAPLDQAAIHHRLLAPIPPGVTYPGCPPHRSRYGRACMSEESGKGGAQPTGMCWWGGAHALLRLYTLQEHMFCTMSLCFVLWPV